MNYNKSGSLYRFFSISYFLKAYSMVVHMAVELSLETKVRPAAPSGAVCGDHENSNKYQSPAKIRHLSGSKTQLQKVD